jgi:tight adherence protein C
MDVLSFTDNTMVLVLCFGAVFLSVVGVAGFFGAKDPIDRLASVTGDGQKSANAAGLTVSNRKSSGYPGFIERIFVPRDKNAKSAIREKLLRAGYRSSSAAVTFFLCRYALALLPLALAAALFPLLAQKLPIFQLGLLVVGAMVHGFFLPSLWLWYKTRGRQQAATEAFPDALDMLLVCVEAGLGLDAALNRVASEIAKAHPVLGEELNYTTAELRAGKTRQDALRALAKRVGVDDIKAFVTVLIQSDKYGTSVADALRVYAQDMRAKRMIRAEEKANKLDVKLTGVVVVLTMPAMMTFLLAPALIQVLEVLGKMRDATGT